MHTQKSVLVNEVHKLLQDLEMQTYHLISARRRELIMVHAPKKTCWIVDFSVPANGWVKLKESEKRDKYQDLAREQKKNKEHESDRVINCNWCACYRHQRIGTEEWGIWI